MFRDEAFGFVVEALKSAVLREGMVERCDLLLPDFFPHPRRSVSSAAKLSSPSVSSAVSLLFFLWDASVFHIRFQGRNGRHPDWGHLGHLGGGHQKGAGSVDAVPVCIYRVGRSVGYRLDVTQQSIFTTCSQESRPGFFDDRAKSS